MEQAKTKVIHIAKLNRPFRFNPFDYDGCIMIARKFRTLALLQGISSIGFIALFALSVYFFNPPVTIWLLSFAVACLLIAKTKVEYKRFIHAQKWIQHNDVPSYINQEVEG